MSESYYNSVLMPLDRIRSAMTGMSKTHKKIAEYLLSNYESAAFLTSIVLARNCGVSESSVIRFSMMLGYSGFTEMQQGLQDVIAVSFPCKKRLEMVQSQMSDNGSILDMILKKNIEGIQRTFLGLDKDLFQRAVKLLAEAERVFFIWLPKLFIPRFLLWDSSFAG